MAYQYVCKSNIHIRLAPDSLLPVDGNISKEIGNETDASNEDEIVFTSNGWCINWF